MKMLRTIRFDASDDHVFERTAGPDEWAVSGLCLFWQTELDQLTGKARQAFANGLLGLPSLGRSTFVSVSEGSVSERETALETLAEHLVHDHGAPDQEAAARAAEAELAFAESLASEQALNTLLAVSRHVDDAGDIREQFRTVTPPQGQLHTRIWDVVEDD